MPQRFDDRVTLIKPCRKGSNTRASTSPLNVFPKHILIAAVFVLICAPVHAGPGMDWGTCCMQAAREQFSEANLVTPWDACGVDPDFDFQDPSPSPSVNVSLGWCKDHCPGYQKSSAEQWLQPLATWVIPALALLVLCSVGEDGRAKDEKWPFYTVYYQFKGYIALLGDPASAICGAFSELWMNALVAKELTKVDNPFEKAVIGVAMLASQTEYHGPDSGHIFRPPSNEMEKQDTEESSKKISQTTRSISKEGDLQSEVYVGRDELSDSDRAAFKNPVFANKLQTGVKTVLKARADFVNGVIVPVVLMLASTGSSFHDAYLNLGANDSAHGLAYGIWYSWLIILAVVSNSYIASVNPGMAKYAIGELVVMHRRTVPLRMRASTAYDWRRWTRTILNESSSVPRQTRPASFYLGYLGGQTVSWLCVAFVCSCAAAISYNTPTIGIGCRSFSFLLYGVLAFVLALLMVLRTWVASRNTQKDAPLYLTAKLLQYLYACITSLNAFVLIFSTAAQLVGLFRSCFCTHFGPLSDMVELSTGTELSIHKAAVTWIPVGFVAYAGVWIVCVIAVCFRTFTNSRIEKLMG